MTAKPEHDKMTAAVMAAQRAYFAHEPSPPGTAEFQCMKNAIQAALIVLFPKVNRCLSTRA